MKISDVFWIVVVLCFCGLLLFAQGDPAHPFPYHAEPPNGWHCYPADAQHHDPAKDEHACTCLGMVEHPDPEARCQPNQPQAPNDHQGCKAWCFKDHCLCATQCEHV